MTSVTAIASSPTLPGLSLQRRALPKPAPRTRADERMLLRHLDVMYKVALSMCGSPHVAQDIVQDVCVRLLSRPRELKPGRELAYLLTAVRNHWFDRLRARAAQPQPAALEDHAHLLASPLPGPSEVADAKNVYQAIADLPEPQRLVVAWIDVAGLSYAEAAETLDVPVGTVMSRLHRGRSRLAAELQPA
jgi:RNA polymerase sigma-70 factor (ECF subfamily)